MTNTFQRISAEEQLTLSLKERYRLFGYREYKMRKFEEYSLYLDNKNFLTSESIIAFNDLNGKLLALKPDVTLSILKNAKATRTSSEKMFYQESVYRLDKQSHEYREINQIGLELLGNADCAQLAEVICLALDSLAMIQDAYLLDISHMGIIEGVFECAGVTTHALKKSMIHCMRSKNEHDLMSLAAANGLSAQQTDVLKLLVTLKGSFDEQLKALESIDNERVKSACKELTTIYQLVDSDKIRLDFSIINDGEYYNGVIFQGYLKGYNQAVLSGGRYDKLADKFKKEIDAVGFALYLSELDFSKQTDDCDVVILYGEHPEKAIRLAKEYRSQGKSVRIEKDIPSGVSYQNLVRV